jgi:hypothetical protein
VLPRDTLERLSNILGIYKSLEILLPARPWFIVLTLVLALFANLLPLSGVALSVPFLERAGWITGAPSTALQAWLIFVVPPLATSVDKLGDLPERLRLLFAFDAEAALARPDIETEARAPLAVAVARAFAAAVAVAPPLTLGPGAAGEVSVCLLPEGPLPAAGSSKAFSVVAQSTTNGAVAQTVNGAYVAPGFIDSHSHHDGDKFAERTMPALLAQGVTTIVVGNDG